MGSPRHWDLPFRLDYYLIVTPNTFSIQFLFLYCILGVEITDTQNFKIQGRGPVSNLIITPYNDRRFFTMYECIAKNKLGEARINLQLKQGLIPGPVSQARPLVITATTIKFSIIPANHFDGLPLRTYTVRYKPERQLNWQFARNHTWSFGKQRDIKKYFIEISST